MGKLRLIRIEYLTNQNFSLTLDAMRLYEPFARDFLNQTQQLCHACHHPENLRISLSKTLIKPVVCFSFCLTLGLQVHVFFISNVIKKCFT